MTAPYLDHSSIVSLSAKISTGKVSSEAIVKHYLNRIKKYDPSLNAFCSVWSNMALEQAKRADDEIRRGKVRSPLHGIPFAMKDIFDVKGLPTGCCSKLRDGHIADNDCFAYKKLRDAGAVFIGKANTHEFALGGPSFELPTPPARNPYNLDHFSGGSSSGSAVAVAADLIPFALGSDTSGSIRGPSFYCGVVGMKPTYGLVSRMGVFPLSYTLDHIGPLTWNVEDNAIVLDTLVGLDIEDPSSVARDFQPFAGKIGKDIGDLNIGYARNFFEKDMEKKSPYILSEIDNLISNLEDSGAPIQNIDIPDFELFSACGRVIMCAESYLIHKENLAMYPEKFGRFTYQRLMSGAGITAADMLQALKLRTMLTKKLNEEAFKSCDILITASALSSAARIDSFPLDWPPEMSMRTIAFSVTGNPSLALPIGHDQAGLPIGVQIVGKPYEEDRVYQVAHWLEQNLSKRDKRFRPNHIA